MSYALAPVYIFGSHILHKTLLINGWLTGVKAERKRRKFNVSNLVFGLYP